MEASRGRDLQGTRLVVSAPEALDWAILVGLLLSEAVDCSNFGVCSRLYPNKIGLCFL